MIYLQGESLTGVVIYDDHLTSDQATLRGVTDWTAVDLTDEAEGDELLASRLAGVRARRNELLTACDWTQMLDVPLDPARLGRWQEYRQRLRDLPATVTKGNMWAVPWPERPEE